LLSLLEAARGTAFKAVLDERLYIPDDVFLAGAALRVKPTVLGRMAGEWWLKSTARSEDDVLCFGNLPPLFRIQGRVSVFLQNRYLVSSEGIADLPLRARVRTLVERYWLRANHWRNRKLIVQTATMATAAKSALGITPVVMPFVGLLDGNAHATVEKKWDFVYVASGEPHKNHRLLLEAWRILAQDKLNPSLCLTVDATRDSELAAWLKNSTQANGLNICNVGHLTPAEVHGTYACARAMIFPSRFESFGLPLIEASKVGLPILAPELDYVRDVCTPTETFDPQSSVSIARAVKRFLGSPEVPISLMSPVDFLTQILGRE
jgi:hypothetical protein